MYIPHTKEEKEEMLKSIGVSSFEEIVKQIPSEFLYPEYDLPKKGLDEQQVRAKMLGLAAKNRDVLSFVGAGAYDRYIPAAVKSVISRGEFLTAYTPYQAEASQGILQTIYEYQSSVCAIYNMDCANASMYDGASAFAEAVRASVRVTGRRKIVYSRAVNPQYVKVLKTYFGGDEGYQYVEAPLDGGVTDVGSLEGLLEGAACYAFQTPNFFGLIEDGKKIAEKVRSKGAMLIVSADPVASALLTPPGDYGADFAVGEGQSLGLPLSYGGPYLGMFSCKKAMVRQMPGRIVGMTEDKDGKRGYVLTLQAREQHIRRDKAASNICSNEALCALSATVYTALLGPKGLGQVAEINAGAAAYAAERLSSVKGVSLKFKGPFFNEFVISVPRDAAELRASVLEREAVDIGLPLKAMYPELGDALLVCATETKTEEDIKKLEEALRRNI